MAGQTSMQNSQELHRVSQLYGAPDFVKTASDADIYGFEELPLHLYADQKNKRFPCHTPAAAWAQYGAFLEKQSSCSAEEAQRIERRFQDFAEYHDLLPKFEEMRKVAAGSRPKSEDSLPDDDFAIVAVQPSGDKIRRCPLRNGEEIRKAAALLSDQYSAFTYDIRLQAATRILQKAAAHGVELSEDVTAYLEKQAGLGVCDPAEAVNMLLDRVVAAGFSRHRDEAAREELLKLADFCTQDLANVVRPDVLHKLASVVDQFDRTFELPLDKLPRAEEILFAVRAKDLTKFASEHCSTTTGSVYKAADLQKVRLGAVRDVLGDDFAEAVTSDGVSLDLGKLATFAQTMPLDEARVFDRLLADEGIQPFSKEAAAAPTGIADSYFASMAESYKQQKYGKKTGRKQAGAKPSLFDRIGK